MEPADIVIVGAGAGAGAKSASVWGLADNDQFRGLFTGRSEPAVAYRQAVERIAIFFRYPLTEQTFATMVAETAARRAARAAATHPTAEQGA
jgi:hypothetical protein